MAGQNVVVADGKSGSEAAGWARFTSISRKKLKNLEINGRARINAWVDTKRASSLTHLKSTPSLDQDQSSRILRHPSALGMFLDYDGALSPVVTDPDKSKKMSKNSEEPAKCFPTAIVSGRCRDRVYKFVNLAELHYAGSHGMDIKGPEKGSKYSIEHNSVLLQQASEFLPMIDEVYKQLLEKTSSTPGAKVQNNKFCLSVHFRRVDEKVRSALKEYPKLRLTQRRKALQLGQDSYATFRDVFVHINTTSHCELITFLAFGICHWVKLLLWCLL